MPSCSPAQVPMVQAEPTTEQIAVALARAAYRLSKDGAMHAAARAYEDLTSSPWKADLVEHWETATAHVDEAREWLRASQHDVRLVATEVGGGDEEEPRGVGTARRATWQLVYRTHDLGNLAHGGLGRGTLVVRVER